MKINDPVKNNSEIKKIIEKIKINLNYLKKIKILGNISTKIFLLTKKF